MQKMKMQSIANTFLHNFSADTVNFTIEGKPLRTGMFDFSEALSLTETTPFAVAIVDVMFAKPVSIAPSILTVKL